MRSQGTADLVRHERLGPWERIGTRYPDLGEPLLEEDLLLPGTADLVRHGRLGPWERIGTRSPSHAQCRRQRAAEGPLPGLVVDAVRCQHQVPGTPLYSPWIL